MNIKLSENELRIRISREDLGALLAGEDIFLNMAIDPDQQLSFILSCSDVINQKIIFTSSQSIFKLLVLRQALLDLEQRLPSKEGIQENGVDYQGQILKLIVEVDIKRR